MDAETEYENIVRRAATATAEAQTAFVQRTGQPIGTADRTSYEYTAGVKDFIDKLMRTSRDLRAQLLRILPALGASSCSVSVGYPWGIQLTVNWSRPDAG